MLMPPVTKKKQTIMQMLMILKQGIVSWYQNTLKKDAMACKGTAVDRFMTLPLQYTKWQTGLWDVYYKDYSRNLKNLGQIDIPDLIRSGTSININQSINRMKQLKHNLSNVEIK